MAIRVAGWGSPEYGARMKLYTVAEVAAETGLSDKALRRRIEKGTLISANRGNRRLIPESELERLLEEVGAGGTPRAAFPSNGGTPGQGHTEGESGGMALEPIMRELADTREHVERLAREAEREKLQREQAEERARSEQEAREAAQAEAMRLSARILELEAVLSNRENLDKQGGSRDAEHPSEAQARAELEQVLGQLEQAAEVVPPAAPPPADSDLDTSPGGEPSRGRLARFLGIG